MKELAARKHWIFDMDGTLTVPMHDFAWLKRQLGIPEDQDILATLSSRPASQAERDRAFIADWEEGIARKAQPQADGLALLASLDARGARLGVLTRNTKVGADLTLEAAGLDGFFAPQAVLSRDCAPAKPDPAGVQRLLDLWGADAADAVVVGDWIYDIRAGRSAGTSTVLVRRHGLQPWEHEADCTVDDLRALLPAVDGLPG